MLIKPKLVVSDLRMLIDVHLYGLLALVATPEILEHPHTFAFHKDCSTASLAISRTFTLQILIDVQDGNVEYRPIEVRIDMSGLEQLVDLGE